MASRKIFHAKPNYIYPTAENQNPHNLYEFNEADMMWNSSNQSTPLDSKKSMPSSSKLPKKSAVMGKKVKENHTGENISHGTAASLPVNIPDWTKIVKDHINYDTDDDDDEGNMLPPHEYLARRRGASFSVHEGIGRTLKGRDLSRLRNAIWKKTGFEQD